MEIVENRADSHLVAPCWLGIFVKQPVPGQVKTRLCPPLDAAQAAALYDVSLLETVARLAKGPWRLRLFYAGDAAWFAGRFPDLPRTPQATGDLGERLRQALTDLLQAGGRAALIGSDSPDLPLGQVAEAFAALDHHQAVSVPARDGGYVLIGARDRCPPLFDAIPWSSAAVLRATRERAAQTGTDYVEVGGWEDIDDAASLGRLLQRSPASATAAHVRARLGACLDLSPAMADNRRQL